MNKGSNVTLLIYLNVKNLESYGKPTNQNLQKTAGSILF